MLLAWMPSPRTQREVSKIGLVRASRVILVSSQYSNAEEAMMTAHLRQSRSATVAPAVVVIKQSLAHSPMKLVVYYAMRHSPSLALVAQIRRHPRVMLGTAMLLQIFVDELVEPLPMDVKLEAWFGELL